MRQPLADDETILRDNWTFAGCSSTGMRAKQKLTRPPRASSLDALARMKSQRRRDTEPETRLRSLLHAMRFRFRTDITPVPGMRCRADIVFPRIKVAVFVDGCFWHACPSHGTLPKQHAQWWRDKLADNTARDRRTDDVLRKSGWSVIRVWEHEDPFAAAKRIADVLERRYPQGYTAGRLHKERIER
jgi:DNA mismatch endonuclease (patch repair protein)